MIIHRLLSLKVWFFLAMLALGVSSYLLVNSLQSTIVPCSIGQCEQVLTSRFSHIGPVSLETLGLVFDIVLVVLVGFLLTTRKPTSILRIVAVGWASIGALVSVVLLGIQAFVLHAFCVYCVSHAILMLLSFACALVQLKSWRMNHG